MGIYKSRYHHFSGRCNSVYLLWNTFTCFYPFSGLLLWCVAQMNLCFASNDKLIQKSSSIVLKEVCPRNLMKYLLKFIQCMYLYNMRYHILNFALWQNALKSADVSNFAERLVILRVKQFKKFSRIQKCNSYTMGVTQLKGGSINLKMAELQLIMTSEPVDLKQCKILMSLTKHTVFCYNSSSWPYEKLLNTLELV